MTTRTHLQPDDLTRLDHLVEARLSPSGRFLAVAAARSVPAANDRCREVLLVDRTRPDATPTAVPEAQHPRWSATDRELFLVGQHPSGAEIRRWGTDAPDRHDVVARLPIVRLDQFELARDRTTAVVTGYVPEAPAELPGDGSAPLIRHRIIRSANGELLPPLRPVLYVVDLGTGSSRRVDIAGSASAQPTEDGSGFDADWFPDGRALVVCLADGWDDDHDLPSRQRQLFRLDLDSGLLSALTHGDRVLAHPKVSPDGTHIAFLRQRGAPDRTVYDFEVCLLELTTGRARSVSHDHDVTVRDFAWTPDGSGLSVVYVERAHGKLGELTLDGRLHELSVGCRGTVDVTAAGTAFVFSDTRTPGAACVLVPGRRTVATVGNPWAHDRRLADTTELTYPSAHVDRREIHAIVARPPGDPEGRPVIVDLHGGPYSDSRLAFDPDREFFVGQGFVVVQPNFRGSVGYGQDFLQLSDRKHYPGWVDRPDEPHEMAWDVVGAIDAVREHRLGDPDRVFLRGFSAGALLATWVLGRTDAFRAAVAQSWYPGEWGAPMYGWFQVRRYFHGPPWKPEHAGEVWRRSPLAMVDRIRTPLLLMQGDRDYFTPALEAEKFYHALKTCGADVALDIHRGETHGLTARPNSHRDTRLREAAWFRSHDREAAR